MRNSVIKLLTAILSCSVLAWAAGCADADGDGIPDISDGVIITGCGLFGGGCFGNFDVGPFP